jgi:hypothetical protein
MRKRNDIYYYVYADTGRHGGRPTCLGYATSRSPLGPFTYQGVIIDNFGCDPEVWNNHGSIAEFDGKWYVFYHRSSKGTIFNRRVCAEPISFREDGSIPEVEMTSQGPGCPIDACRSIDAGIACLLHGNVRIDSCQHGGEQLSRMSGGDWAAYKYLDFGGGVSSFSASISSAGSGTLELRLGDPDGLLAGAYEISSLNSNEQCIAISCNVAKIMGVHALYLRLAGNVVIKLSCYQFI